MTGELPGVPKIQLPIVDIRDVALGHWLALTKDIPNGSRISLYQESSWLENVISIINEEFKPYGYKINTKIVGYCPLKIASYFNSEAKFMLPFIGNEVLSDNTLSK